MKKILAVVSGSGLCLLAWALQNQLVAQPPRPSNRFDAQRREAVAEAFKGITTDGQPTKGLFKIQATGVSTEPVRSAAKKFLDSLAEEDRKRTLFPVDDLEWRKWDNRHRYARQGMGFTEMSEQQRERAFGLLHASLSPRGLRKTQDIMKLNGTLAELTRSFNEYGEWLYWITIMGEPSATEPWGWQLDGHHVVINYFVIGDQIVMTPVFMGSEPVRADSGKFKGTVVMQDEQDLGLNLMLSLDAAQQAKAIIRSEKGPTNNLTEAFHDNVVLDFVGIPASQLNDRQKQLLLRLIGEYVGNMKQGHARVKMDEVKSYLEETYFAWIGETQSDGVFYYRIQSPVILIEFDHQRPIALARSSKPTRNHIHTVVRTPNGNDYGKDLLRQHYHQHQHGDDGHVHEH